MKLVTFAIRFIGWLVRQIEFVKFRISHPNVPIIRPLTIGNYFSQDGQDLYLSALLFNEFKNFDGGYVVDIGCNDPERFSNSYFFEKFFKCNVLAIDPIEEYAAKWEKIRPSAKFIPTALGSFAGVVTLNIPNQSAVFDDMFSSVTGKNPKIGNLKCSQRQVPCVTLESIFDFNKISEVNLISIDVEGAELDVLKGINFERVYIKCFVIENNTKSLFGSDDIRLFLKSKGYLFHSRIGYLDDVFIHNSLLGPIVND